MKTMDYDGFRRNLRDYRTRAMTIAAAFEEPESYLNPALRLLDDRSGILRWCAIRILTEIGDERAVAPLTAVRESGRNKVEIADALRVITGRHPDEAGGAPYTEDEGSEAGSLTDDELVGQAVHGLSASLSGSTPHYNIMVSLPDGRSQDIMVDFSRTDPDGRSIVYLCTACGAVDESKYESVLKFNMIIPYGAIGIAKVEDEVCFAMVNTYLRETVNPRELGFSIMTLAREGDSIQQAIARQN